MPRLSPSEPVIHPDCEVVNTTFGAYCELGRGSRVQNSEFLDYSYTDRATDIANATIGKFANIASYTRIGPTDHPLHTASLHHFLYRSADYWDDAEFDEDFFAHRMSRRAVIGHDTWLGHNCIIKPEVTVGDGAVVASGAVVTRDVEPYTIVAGMPAKPMRRRQPPEIAERMMELAWWDWDHDRLRAALPDFRTMSAEAFLEKYA